MVIGVSKLLIYSNNRPWPYLCVGTAPPQRLSGCSSNKTNIFQIKPGQKDDFDEPEKLTLQLRPPVKRKINEEEEEKEEEEPKKSKVNEEGDYTVVCGSKLKGQHGAELLLELPHSAMREYGMEDRVFGFVVQGTKVRVS